MGLSRRGLLAQSAAIATVAAFAGFARAGQPRTYGSARAGYGRLIQRQPDMRLPRGFAYVKGGAAETPMRDGGSTPMAHDSMGVFEAGDRLHLVRNHELDPEDFAS